MLMRMADSCSFGTTARYCPWTRVVSRWRIQTVVPWVWTTSLYKSFLNTIHLDRVRKIIILWIGSIAVLNYDRSKILRDNKLEVRDQCVTHMWCNAIKKKRRINNSGSKELHMSVFSKLLKTSRYPLPLIWQLARLARFIFLRLYREIS